MLDEGTIIGNNCNLNECSSGKGVRVGDNSKLKSEILSNDDGTKEDGENDCEDEYGDGEGDDFEVEA